MLLNFSMMEFGLEIILRMVKTWKYFGFPCLKFRDVISEEYGSRDLCQVGKSSV